jgi:D-glucuronyl C5-epimerase C-terminus
VTAVLARRRPQLRSEFEAGVPSSGYYNDLTAEVSADSPKEAVRRLERLTADPRAVNHVSVAQLGLGCWQLGWRDAAARVADRLARALDGDGLLRYGFAMPHTYRLEPGWASALAQGQAASLFVRVGLPDAAQEAVRPLVAEPSELRASTEHGPVLQEYPTDPPAHVLNGWIFALWGLYDVARGTGDEVAADAFEDGVAALAARLPRYELAGRWSRYDLYPHPIAHAASPFYHRLHVEQLRALDELAPAPAFREYADRWAASARSYPSVALGVGRKVAFRLLRPRRR